MPKSSRPTKKALRRNLDAIQDELQHLQYQHYRKPMPDFQAKLQDINSRVAKIVRQLATLDILRDYTRRMRCA